uniref:Uncharacterized protein n=1 Tax=Arundo donax TaxID=35708 RepID=A0A0A8Z1A9_ARUDO
MHFLLNAWPCLGQCKSFVLNSKLVSFSFWCFVHLLYFLFLNLFSLYIFSAHFHFIQSFYAPCSMGNVHR